MVTELELSFFLGAIAAWFLLGCGVLAYIDKDARILKWAESAPYGLGAFVPVFWPLVLYYTRRP